MKNIDYTQVLAPLAQKLANGGVFLTVNGKPANTMTIGWASAGVYWGKPVCVVLVRPQRHTFSLLENADEFTVSIPTTNPLTDELKFAGTRSGRDYDKFSGHGLTAVAGQKVGAPVVGECGLHLECKIVHRQPLVPGEMDQPLFTKAYPLNDYHMMYWGEIVASYSTDE
jgi:flavin reductase (DIM6/NTAB) family NADH-FMN oxidoreductase RutF